ncbi:MAG TPA: response regulator [Candidatus Sulfotelmatobacter sp.]|jgi:two-component system cell cycle sensor histidine kinase/response regulator CckA|nr:response regulator [Candidatus Sulfotelmatobacter sp.]
MDTFSNQAEKEGLRKPYRILCLEDNLNDRTLLASTLLAEGIACDFAYAQTRQEFESALGLPAFDLIISDFTLPGYDGMSALARARTLQAETPFIFVSGTIGEDRAIESLKNGATDYVLKDRRDRLVSAVQRALREGRERAERKKLEEQLRQAQKMEAIGQLAGGVAHDFNNLLAVIQGNAELALMESGLDGPLREYLTQITGASGRAANLTRQLLAFGRKHAMRPQPLNLNSLVGNLTRMLKRIIGEDVRLECQYDGQPFVHADPGMIEQVILNLVVNARDAMPNGGQLVVSTRTVHLDETITTPHPEVRSGEFACLSVSDTGTGITPENLAHIFEPFFTTKEIGKGTGLGLATVYGVVKQHDGWVDVSSRVNEGTTFEIFLPAIQPPAGTPPPAHSQAKRRGGTERILLVEDDEAVRLMTRLTLERHGYRIIEACSGRKALEMWHAGPLEIDLLLTDIVMPEGIDGRRLAELLREQTPALKVVFVSGYSLNVISKDTEFFKRRNNYFLQKPYPAHVLIETVRHCLDEVPA